MNNADRRKQTNTIGMLIRRGYERLGLRHFAVPAERDLELEERAKALELKFLVKK